jgi:predicted dehydrogenase
MIANAHRRAAILSGAEIVGVLGSSAAASERLAAEWHIAAFATFEHLLASDVDVVHICTPNATHSPYALAALAAGKHVVCEKPLGLTHAEAAEMTAVAADAGLVGTIPFVYRYHPLVREIRDRRIAGEFGDWNLLHGSYLQDWMLSPSVSGWRVNPALGGTSRAFADIGSHWCDLVEWVSGERIAEVTAQLSTAVAKRPAVGGESFSGASSATGELVDVTTEDIASVLFRTTSGVPGSLTVSQVAAGRKNRLWFELDGSEASAVFDQENTETVWIGRERSAEILFRDPQFASLGARAVTALPSGHAQGWAECFEHFVGDTYRAIAGHTVEGLPTFSDGARSASLVDAVLRSASTRAWESIT